VEGLVARWWMMAQVELGRGVSRSRVEIEGTGGEGKKRGLSERAR
jgi:hypothetical protein